MQRFFVFFAGVSGTLAVGLGAFGAHALQARLTPRAMAVYQTAVQYHLVHSLALLSSAWLVFQAPGPLAQASGWAFAAGLLLFCGSLYALALTDVRVLGAIAPLGGLSFIVGWLCLSLVAWRHL